ncbi:DEAD/DEAH box helicase [uncultured Sphingomonas sp.]|uniref:DEAD/DEAH box helicase n=1 Tax=uncultured Sphingomonas sp. TaxID=158754 RepID=UPI002604DBF4|nr:DEAD/DEAH box helicase [uncultured Sphingomonas sp.]
MFDAFRRKPTAQTVLRWTSEGDMVLLWLERAGRRLPVDEWGAALPALAPVLDRVRDRIEAGSHDQSLGSSIGEDGLQLAPSLVAGLDGEEASALGLPAATAFALDLHPIDRIDQDSFRVRMRWVRPGGQPVRATARGAILESEVGPRRIPQPLFELLQASTPLTQPLDTAARFEALARLRGVWPEDPRTPVESDGYLKDLRIHYAAGVSLKLTTLTPEHTAFDPVLFNVRDVAEDIVGAGPAGVDEDVDNILPPASQRLFAEDRFRRETTARPAYVLRDGEYVFIDPSLRPLLDVIRQVQEAPEVERRDFILNPRRVFRERLGDDASDAVGLDDRFIDTEQFSARVAGVDVWRTPVLPWLAGVGGNSWLPERFGLRVGEDYFALPAQNVAAVIERFEASAAAGEASADVSGLLEPATPDAPSPPDRLPVNDQCRAALNALAPFASVTADAAEDDLADPAWDATRGKLFLVVRDNFEEVDYAPFAGQDEPDLPPATDIDPPAILTSSLKPHQTAGLGWLVHAVRCGRPGALLADDMGLGKTLQAIAFMAYLQERAALERRDHQPFLIVAPTGLLGTWRDEIAKHLALPRLGTLVPAFGANLKLLREEDGFGARDIETGKAALNAAEWRDAGVVLTTYETMRDYHFSFAKTRFGLIIYDEIQKLKNPASQVSRAAKALNADFVLGMTGTPVENRLQDLWAIMDVVSPGLLGASRDFEARHDPVDKEALARLKALLSEPHGRGPQPMLRRMKSDALDAMPHKTIHTLEQDMPGIQADAYRDLVLHAAAAGNAGNLGQGGMLSVLARMRGVSLHPVDPREAPDDLDGYAAGSARLSQTLTVLDRVAAAGEKALIFVEDLAMQDRLAGMIKARFKLQRRPMRINGSVAGPKRQEMVNAFQAEDGRFDVMILSPKAGGVGLTLTAANHVIHLSRWWNPAVEDQATDRVFRIGQTRDVHVHLPLAIHPDVDLAPSSFDRRLDALINRKRALTRDLFLPPEVGEAELSNLFREVSLEAGAEDGDQSVATPEAPPVPTMEPSVPVPAAMMADAGIRLWRRAPGEGRPTDEILALFAGKHITQLAIRDPYALVDDDARRAQARFVAELAAAAAGIDGVLIEYAPEIDRHSNDAADRRAFGADYAAHLLGSGPRLSLVRRHKRGGGDDFHDRFIEIDVRGADGTSARHELTIGRGVLALYDVGRQCTVTYAPPRGAL